MLRMITPEAISSQASKCEFRISRPSDSPTIATIQTTREWERAAQTPRRMACPIVPRIATM
jgi:hypothetical protein